MCSILVSAEVYELNKSKLLLNLFHLISVKVDQVTGSQVLPHVQESLLGIL